MKLSPKPQRFLSSLVLFLTLFMSSGAVANGLFKAGAWYDITLFVGITALTIRFEAFSGGSRL